MHTNTVALIFFPSIRVHITNYNSFFCFLSIFHWFLFFTKITFESFSKKPSLFVTFFYCCKTWNCFFFFHWLWFRKVNQLFHSDFTCI